MSSRPEKGSELELRIGSLAFGGRGVARVDDFVVFVDRALPGDLVRARINRGKRRYAEASAVALLEPGPNRVEPRCPHYGRCGGCRFQDLAYPQQLAHKEQTIRDAIERIGHQTGVEIAPIVGAPETYGYRNKIELSFAHGEDGVRLGFHLAGRWEDILPIDACHLVGDAWNAARDVVEQWARDHSITAYDRRTHDGYLRNLILRGSERTGELLVTVVTSEGKLPRPAQLEEELRERVPSCVGLLHAATDRPAEVTQGLDTSVVFGHPWYTERLLDLDLRVSSGAFLQTNTAMCERLYRIAIEEAGLEGDEIVWDLYSGIGSIALALARDAGQVFGIEIVEEAVERAAENAERNGVDNVTFVHGDVAKAIQPLIEGGVPRPEIVVVDPPRAGLVPKAVRRIVELEPQRIVYVSCNPTTLAGNAEQIVEAGYRLVSVRPVDMFPHTHHVECVARFEAPA